MQLGGDNMGTQIIRIIDILYCSFFSLLHLTYCVMITSKPLFLQTSLPSLFSAHLKDFLEMRFLLLLKQTERELHKINLVQALYDNMATLLYCHLDSIVPMHH